MRESTEMPAVFVHDFEIGYESSRDWQELLGNHTVLSWDGVQLAGGDPAPGDVIVSHREPSDVRAVFETLAKNGSFIIYVRQHDIREGGPQGKTYKRKKGVGKRTDPHFAACFNFFLRRLHDSGQADWELLEGPPPPDALLAYHLLGLLPAADKDASALREALVETAKAEVQAITKVNPSIPPLASFDDPNQRREFLRMCS